MMGPATLLSACALQTRSGWVAFQRGAGVGGGRRGWVGRERERKSRLKVPSTALAANLAAYLFRRVFILVFRSSLRDPPPDTQACSLTFPC